MGKESFEYHIRNVPLCGKCLIFMHCKKNDVAVLCKSYSAIGDLFECPKCHALILSRFGQIFSKTDQPTEYTNLQTENPLTVDF